MRHFFSLIILTTLLRPALLVRSIQKQGFDPSIRMSHGERELQRQLLFLFDVHGVLAQSRRILLQLQLFSAWLATQNVVVIAGFFTNQEYGFGLFLAFCHVKNSLFLLFVIRKSAVGVQRTRLHENVIGNCSEKLVISK